MNQMISVIVPCYNVEKYIDRCLTSLVRQTIGLSNIELILVNDCSTDKTYNCLLMWEKQYEDNIIVVNSTENRGSGGARNLGMYYAKGEYIGFIDADDWIEPNMYEKLLYALTQNSCDIAQCMLVRNAEECYNNKGDIKSEQEPILIHIDGDEMRNELMASGIISGYPVTKLYRKELLIKNNIYFLEKIVYEDLFFLGLLTLYVDRVVIIREELYHYFYNPISLTSLTNNTYHRQILDVTYARLEEYKERGVYNQLMTGIHVDFIRRYYLSGMITLARKLSVFPLEEYMSMRDTVLSVVGNTYKEDNILRYFDENQKKLILLLDISLDDEDWKCIVAQLRM